MKGKVKSLFKSLIICIFTLIISITSLNINSNTTTVDAGWNTGQYSLTWYNNGEWLEGWSGWTYDELGYAGGRSIDFIWLKRTSYNSSTGDVTYQIQAGLWYNLSWLYWGTPYKFTCSNGQSTTVNPGSSTKTSFNGYTNVMYNTGGSFNLKAGNSYTINVSVVNIDGETSSVGSITINVPKPNCTATFNANGGSTPSPSTITKTYGSQLGTLPTTSRTGYTFAGWYTASSGGSKISTTTTLTSNVTYYAQWTPITYYVSYVGNGSTSGSTESSSHTYDVAKNLTKNGFTKTGYTFSGWNTKSDGSGTSYTDGQSVKNLTTTNKSTVTLYAQWKVNSYTITFNPNGGTVNPTSKTVSYGSKYGTLPTPSRLGYAFQGWYTSASGGTKVTEDTVMGTSNVTVYAHWALINPTLTTKSNIYRQDEALTISKIITDNAKATDVVEGTITNKIKISKIIYPDGSVVNNPSTFDITKFGVSQVTYVVTTDRGGSATQTNTIQIIPLVDPDTPPTVINKASIYSRFIGDDELADGGNAKDTLEMGSIWSRIQSYKDALSNSLSRDGNDYIKEYTVGSGD